MDFTGGWEPYVTRTQGLSLRDRPATKRLIGLVLSPILRAPAPQRVVTNDNRRSASLRTSTNSPPIRRSRAKRLRFRLATEPRQLIGRRLDTDAQVWLLCREMI